MKIRTFLVAAPACLFTSAFSQADELQPPCRHPYDEPTRVVCVYTFTGNEQSFQVPQGVHMLDITAIGAAGAAGDAIHNYLQSGAGGLGGYARTLISVTPGSTLHVEVGGTPTTDPSKCNKLANPPVRCLGGWNGGGSAQPQTDAGGMGGGGGGASDVRIISASLPESLNSRLIVAGGGGGGGSSCNGICNAAGGDGGAAGSAGKTGEDSPPDQPGGTGGGAGTLIAGGEGGFERGTAGSLGQGGNGGVWYNGHNGYFGMGAGGGGGYYGGGGGGVPTATYASGPGGGGGGSSFAPDGEIGVTSEPASVRIMYIIPHQSQTQ